MDTNAVKYLTLSEVAYWICRLGGMPLEANHKRVLTQLRNLYQGDYLPSPIEGVRAARGAHLFREDDIDLCIKLVSLLDLGIKPKHWYALIHKHWAIFEPVAESLLQRSLRVE